MLTRSLRLSRMVLAWALVFLATVFANMVVGRVQEARAVVSPSAEVAAVAAQIAGEIGADPAAVGNWMVLEDTGWAWGHAVSDWAESAARGYLRVVGDTEARQWVGRLDHAAGPAQAVLVYVAGQGVADPRETGVSAAVFCFPARDSGEWVPLFWDGPWADNRRASAKALMPVCTQYAPLATASLPWA